MLGSVQHGGDALVRLNDAFAPDPVFVDVPGGRARSAGRCSSSTGATRARPPSPASACGSARGPRCRSSRSSPAPTGRSRSLVVPVTELAAADGASLSYVSLQVLGAAAWSIARLAARGAARLVAAHLHRRPRRRLRPGAGRRLGRRPATPAARSCPPTSATATRCTTSGRCRTTRPPRTTSELLCQGAVAGPVALGLQRADPGPPRRGAQRRPPDQPQPRARRGRARRLGAQPRHPRERRDVLPRLDGRPDRRGPALLHRVAGRGARGGRGAHRARVLRRHHRPGPRARGDPVPPA